MDSDFHWKNRVERSSEVWRLLEKLPDEVFSNITTLLSSTPEEVALLFASIEFDRPVRLPVLS